MELLIKKFQNTHFARPFKVYGTEMQPSLLLMCKLLVLLLFAHGFFFYLKDPFLPFIPQLDFFNESPFVFQYIIRSIFLISCALLLFNIKVRYMAVVIGLTIIISIVASKPMFRNHLFIVGCVLFLAGLSDKNKEPWLIYFQLSLVYFGALTNKIFELDWWTGQFMHNWLSEALNNGLYISVSEFLPEKVLAKLIAYSAMLSEFIIGVCLLFPRFRFYAITTILIFHTLLFTFVGTTFGFFMQDILIILIAFSSWTNSTILFKYKSKRLSVLIKSIRFLDWDNRIIFQYDPLLVNELEFTSDNKNYVNTLALARVLLSITGFFALLFFIELGIRVLFNEYLLYVAMLIFFWSFLILISPILVHRLKNKK